MAATITVGKSSRAFQKDGKTIFILSENTYEKNVTPHTPHWGVIAFGTYESVLTRVFANASACDSGDLQGKGRDISATGYIKAWREAIANSSEDINHTNPQEITLSVSESIYSPINLANLESAQTILRDGDYFQTAQALGAGEKIVLNVIQDLDILLALFAVGKGKLSAGTIFRGGDHYSAKLSFELGIPKQSLTKPILDPIEFVKTPCEHLMFVRQGNNLFNQEKSPWIYGDQFIANTLLPFELAYPGSAESIIRQFKAMVSNAGIIPGDTVIDITLPENPVGDWSLTRWVKELAGAKSRSFTFEEIAKDITLVWQLKYLASERVTYTLVQAPILPEPKSVIPKLISGIKMQFARPLQFGAFEEDVFTYLLEGGKSRFLARNGTKCRISKWRGRDFALLA